MEYLDIYNDNHELLGTCEKKLAHKLGMWHEVFTCQFINQKKKTAIFQIKNHNNKNINDKDLIEITVGGHYRSGEKIEDGIRELKEETGIDVDFKQLKYLGVRQVATTVNPNYIVREFQHIFLCFTDKEITEFNCNDNEVTEFIEFNIDELIELLLGKSEYIFGNIGKERIKITLENFVDSYLKGDKLYLRLLIAAKRYINEEDPELIFW